MGGAQVKQFRNEYICTAKKPDHTQFTLNTLTWQKQIDDNRYLSSLTIPGTHQSISVEGGYAGVITVAQCQSWSIQDQLNSGIRAFDIRGKCKKGKFKAYHGIVDQKQDISQIMLQFYEFLVSFPSEFIVMMVKEEDNKTKANTITQVFDSMVSQEQKDMFWFMENRIPTVKELRGKIFFIPRWNYGKGFRSYRAQDKYNVELPKKVKHIEEFRKRTVMCESVDNGGVLYINYLSGATVKDWPLSYAKVGNKHLYQNYICRGLIMMDFPGEKLIDKLIGLNLMNQQQLIDNINVKYLSENKQNQIKKISFTLAKNQNEQQYQLQQQQNVKPCQQLLPGPKLQSLKVNNVKKQESEKIDI